MDCVFCKIVEKKVPAKIRYEDKEILAFDDVNPNAPTHILIIPKKHLESLKELKNIAGKIGEVAEKLANYTGVAKTGWRLLVNNGPDAGQVIDHLHFHLLGVKRLGPIG